MGLDGKPPVRVTTGPHMVGSPVWTPDGGGLLYVSNADGAWDVYHQAVDGTGRPNDEPRRPTTGLNAHGIRVSRDGYRLTYSLVNSLSNIFAAPLTAGGVTPASALRAITDENQTVETVDVTADGAWLAFESNRGGRSHIYKLSLVSGELVQLTNGPAEEFAPKWSPDAKRIAFHRREPTKDGLRDVYVMNADGGELTRLTDDTVDHAYPRWSADGRRLTVGVGLRSVMRADGRWGVPERDTLRGQWTRDGRYRVFTYKGDLYAQPNGGSPRRLASAQQLGGRGFTVGLAPDPAVVYIRVIDTAGVHSFYSVPTVGGPPRLRVRLDHSPPRPARIIFSADSAHLYFTVTHADSDVWMMTLRR
jgi:dipeptidyl aminopeptidase/acylaminoacyl peptidase